MTREEERLHESEQGAVTVGDRDVVGAGEDDAVVAIDAAVELEQPPLIGLHRLVGKDGDRPVDCAGGGLEELVVVGRDGLTCCQRRQLSVGEGVAGAADALGDRLVQGFACRRQPALQDRRLVPDVELPQPVPGWAAGPQALSDAVEEALPGGKSGAGGDTGAHEQHEVAASQLTGDASRFVSQALTPITEIPERGEVAPVAALEKSPANALCRRVRPALPAHKDEIRVVPIGGLVEGG